MQTSLHESNVDETQEVQTGLAENIAESSRIKNIGENNKDIHVVLVKDEPTCGIIDEEYYDSAVADNSTKDFEIESIYQCKECNAIFFNKAEFDDHDTEKCQRETDRVKTRRQRIYRCNLCSRQFSARAIWMIHMENHSMDKDTSDAVETEDIIPENPSEQEDYDSDAEYDSNTKAELYTCSICAKEYSTKRGYDNHVKSHRAKKEIFDETGGDLASEGMRFECPICAVVLTDGELFKDHLNGHLDLDENLQESDAAGTGLHCEICGQGFSSENVGYKKHMKVHQEKGEIDGEFDIAEYSCNCFICKTAFTTKRGYEMHMQRHLNKDEIDEALYRKLMHSNSKPAIIQCVLCEKGFSTKKGYKLHMQKHAELGERAENAEHDATYEQQNFTCQFCSITFHTDEELFDHVKCHDRGQRWKCTICQQTLKDKRGLKAHMKRHAGVKEYVCETCGAQFIDRPNLLRHRALHKSGKPFVCHICNKSFKVKEYLASHLKTHLKIRPYVCEVCGKGYVSNHALKVHTREHSDPKDYFHCDQCGKSFAQKGNLKKHQESHRGIKRFQCAICQTFLSSKWSLEAHMYSHNDKPMPYQCRLCEKSFMTKSRLNEHHAQHAGKTYSCAICPKQYRFKNKLTIHMRTHTGDHPYVCSICGERFIRNDYLLRHCRKNHPNSSTLVTQENY
ncbi:uncharacterized protein LOC141899409 isoform X2 [Tubulanus polymorphus]